GHAVYAATFYGFTVSPGARIEVIGTDFVNGLAGTEQDSTQTAILPGVGVTYAFTEELGVLAGVYRGFSPVSPGQPDEVEPEFSWNVEAGARYVDTDTESLAEVIGFYNHYTNLTGECSFASGCTVDMLDRQFNAGTVDIAGAEVAFQHNFQLPAGLTLPVRAGYTFTWSRFASAFESDNPQFGNVEEGDRLPYVPEHQGTARVGLEHERFSVNVSAVFASEMREEASQGDSGLRTDPYVMLDAVVGVNVWESLQVYVRGENLLFAEPIASRRPFGARPAKPFQVQVGVRFDYDSADVPADLPEEDPAIIEGPELVENPELIENP
ncbi:MAG: TonB-dependent receptor, partial [Myxococcota bacterium]